MRQNYEGRRILGCGALRQGQVGVKFLAIAGFELPNAHGLHALRIDPRHGVSEHAGCVGFQVRPTVDRRLTIGK